MATDNRLVLGLGYENSDQVRQYSYGGISDSELPNIYPLSRLNDIKEYCEKMGWDYWEYVEHYEGKEIWDYLREVWKVMREAVERGLEHEGVLPGPLHLRRKAASYYIKVAA